MLIVNASLLCGGILVHSSLQNCFNSETLREFEYEHPVLSHSKASKSHLSPNFDRASSSFCLSLSEVDSLMCFGSLFYCITHVSLRFRTQTDGWTFSFRMFWYRADIVVPSITAKCPEAAKQPQTFTVPPPCMTAGMMVCL